MKKRHELGLGLFEVDSKAELPKEKATPYHQAQLGERPRSGSTLPGRRCHRAGLALLSGHR